MFFLLTAQQKNVNLMVFGNNGSDLSLGGRVPSAGQL